MGIRREFEALGKRPQKRLGQNFLTDQRVIRDMIRSADIQPGETVVEIGSGLGALTLELVKVAKHVLAIEADRELAEQLRRKSISNLTVVTGDALRIDWTVTIEGEYKIVANIPYSLTSPLLKKIFHLAEKPAAVILLIQKEMAERLVAPPGSSERGWLTIITEANGEAEIIRSVHPGSFRPSPSVESAIIRLKLRPKSSEETILWPALQAGFRQKRKTLANSLATGLHLPKSEVNQVLGRLKINQQARPQELSYKQWQTLSRLLLRALETTVNLS